MVGNALSQDVFRIDLGKVAGKYSGETEKNIDAVFDAAERAGGVLLIDEADALFGKRSEVEDPQVRYANIDIAYLLQRIERHTGLVILTSNLREDTDPLFTVDDARRRWRAVRFPR
jgi:SpoVK/Ycf46/Vps4 family AAA+-type ATPase